MFPQQINRFTKASRMLRFPPDKIVPLMNKHGSFVDLYYYLCGVLALTNTCYSVSSNYSIGHRDVYLGYHLADRHAYISAYMLLLTSGRNSR
jgi:hypothetical protein